MNVIWRGASVGNALNVSISKCMIFFKHPKVIPKLNTAKNMSVNMCLK